MSFGRDGLRCILLVMAATTVASSNEEAVLARVAGRAILKRHVERELRHLPGSPEVASEASEALRAAALQQLVQQARVLFWLQQKNYAASDREVALARDELLAEIERREIPLVRYLAERHLAEEDLEDVLRWQLSWRRYLDRYLTDANLKKYFESHQSHFDGSRRRVRHILFRVPPDASAEAWATHRSAAEAVRQQIHEGSVTFVAAAKQHSDAPTADEGGDLGWIARHEPMPESFSQVAFDLELGAVSAPVRSHFGIHLIQCDEVEPGQRTWEDARQELEVAVTRYLFDWIADQSTAEVER